MTLNLFLGSEWSASVQCERHSVSGQVDRSCHKIIDGSKPRLAENFVVDDAEVFKVSVSVPDSAVESDQGEQPFHVLIDVRGVGKLLEPFHDRGLIAATVFLVGPARVKNAEIF